MTLHIARIVGLVAFGTLFILLLQSDPFRVPLDAPTVFQFLDPAVLAVHETGHVITGMLLPSQQFLMVAAGSLVQWSVPLLFCLLFLWRGETFSASVLLGLTAFSLLRSVPYINDATAMALPLFPSNDAIHDWNYLLGHLGLLGTEYSVALAFARTGKALLLLSVAGMLWSTLWPLRKRRVYESQGILETERLPAVAPHEE